MPSGRSVVVLVVAFVLGGSACLTTKTVQRPKLLPPEQGIVQARAIVGPFSGKKVDVELAAASPARADSPTVVRTGTLAPVDATTYLLYEPGAPPARIPFGTTRKITYNNRLLGLVIGFGVGAFVGGLVGVIVGSGFGCDGHDRCPFNSEGARQAGVFCGLLAGVVGAVLGTIGGYRTRVTF